MKTFSLILLPFFLSLCIGSLESCNRAEREGSAATLITVSIPPQAWLVERIAGPEVQVISLIQGGESPATYQPSDKQVSQVMGSRVFFRLGLPFEAGRWLDAIDAAGSGLQVVNLRDGLSLREFSG
ncbi:MAG: zinc ABC transporter substrate-binding protein, partial [Planctomycetes bacterium]|nr:zinc ABC transporter substrate-binding protein [Planctomycetota bacterium]